VTFLQLFSPLQSEPFYIFLFSTTHPAPPAIRLLSLPFVFSTRPSKIVSPLPPSLWRGAAFFEICGLFFPETPSSVPVGPALPYCPFPRTPLALLVDWPSASPPIVFFPNISQDFNSCCFLWRECSVLFNFHNCFVGRPPDCGSKFFQEGNNMLPACRGAPRIFCKSPLFRRPLPGFFPLPFLGGVRFWRSSFFPCSFSCFFFACELTVVFSRNFPSPLATFRGGLMIGCRMLIGRSFSGLLPLKPSSPLPVFLGVWFRSPI